MSGFQLVGYYVEKPKEFEGNTSKKFASIKVKTKTNFKASFGEEHFETYEVYLWRGMCLEFMSAIPLNSAISIKGRLQKINDEVVLIAELVEKMDTMHQTV